MCLTEFSVVTILTSFQGNFELSEYFDCCTAAQEWTLFDAVKILYGKLTGFLLCCIPTTQYIAGLHYKPCLQPITCFVFLCLF